jgi:signal peptidase I
MDPEHTLEKRLRQLRAALETTVLLLLIALVVHFATQSFIISGTSMEPGLHNTEFLLIDRWAYLFHSPEHGDVIVFRAPPEPSRFYVKRVIGVPGDVITVRGTRIIVDGVTLKETYVASQNQGMPIGTRPIKQQEVPPGDYFVLGDNRAVSSDSRIWGFVPQKNILGRAAFIYWPLGEDNDGWLPDVSPVFATLRLQHNQAYRPLDALMANFNALWLVPLLALLLVFLRRRLLKRWLFPPGSQKNNRQDCKGHDP